MARKSTVVEIKPLEIEELEILIVGTTPLITHCWSEKAKKEMLDKQMGVTKTKKKNPKNPIEDFVSSMYWLDEHSKPTEYTQEAVTKALESKPRFGFPSVAIKMAAVSAAYRNGWTKDKVSVSGSFQTLGTDPDKREFVIIESDPPIMREDMVKIGMGTADLRYRGEFHNWKVKVLLSYNKNGPYSLEQIINMINIGGYSVGLGEWRTEKGGMFGSYVVGANK